MQRGWLTARHENNARWLTRPPAPLLRCVSKGQRRAELRGLLGEIPWLCWRSQIRDYERATNGSQGCHPVSKAIKGWRAADELLNASRKSAPDGSGLRPDCARL
jgi:hypothetical protein